MVIEIIANGKDGEAEKMRISFPNVALMQTYAQAGQPYGLTPTEEDYRQFLEDMVNGRMDEEEIKNYAIQIKPRDKGPHDAKVVILAVNEADLIPPDARKRGYNPPPETMRLNDIMQNLDRFMGNLVIYKSINCEFWTVAKDHLDYCDDTGDNCMGHCPHCGSPVAPYPVEMFLDEMEQGLERHGDQYVGSIVAAYAENCQTCWPQWQGYMEDAPKFAEYEQKCNAAKSKDLPGDLYAHIKPDYELPGPEVCPTCQGAADPVAYVGDEIILTWECEKGCRYFKQWEIFARWPFLEDEATAADLIAAGWVK